MFKDNTTKFFAYTGIVVIACILWAFFVFGANGGAIRDLKTQIEQLEQQFSEVEAVGHNYAGIEARYNEKLTEYDALKADIPNREAYTQIFGAIRELATRQNVQILSLSPLLEDSFPALKSKLKTTDRHIERYPVEFQIRGDYLTIGTMLEELLNLPAVINIGAVNLESELESGGLILGQIILYTYTMFETQ